MYVTNMYVPHMIVLTQLAQTTTKWEVVYEMVVLPDQHTTLSNNCNSDNERYYIVHVLIAYILT